MCTHFQSNYMKSKGTHIGSFQKENKKFTHVSMNIFSLRIYISEVDRQSEDGGSSSPVGLALGGVFLAIFIVLVIIAALYYFRYIS